MRDYNYSDDVQLGWDTTEGREVFGPAGRSWKDCGGHQGLQEPQEGVDYPT
jgi:hypothetical protein